MYLHPMNSRHTVVLIIIIIAIIIVIIIAVYFDVTDKCVILIIHSNTFSFINGG